MDFILKTAYWKRGNAWVPYYGQLLQALVES